MPRLQAACIGGILWEACAEADAARMVMKCRPVVPLLHVCSRFLPDAARSRSGCGTRLWGFRVACSHARMLARVACSRACPLASAVPIRPPAVRPTRPPACTCRAPKGEEEERREGARQAVQGQGRSALLHGPSV